MLDELYGALSWVFFFFFFYILKQDWSTHSKSCFAVKLHKHFVDYKNLIWFPVDMKMSR